MKPSTLLLIGVGGYIALRLAGLNKISNKLSFAPGSIGVKRDGSKITISFGMDIDNPTPVEATINRTYGTVTDAKGNVIGKFNVPKYTVGAAQITRIQIPIEVTIGGFIKSLIMSLVAKQAIVSINYTNELGVLTISDSYVFDLKKELKMPEALRKLTNRTETRENPLITNPV